MRVKIIGGHHKGKCLTVQDNIVQIVLPSTMRATFSVEYDETCITVCKSYQYKLYKQYKYLDGDISSYFIPDAWAHHEVERMLMDAIPCVN